MPTVNFQAPTEYSTEAEQIARQRKYAELMQQQAVQPIGGTEMAGGWAIRRSPLEGLAKMVQAFGAYKGQQDADEKAKALGERYTREGNAALAKGLEAYTGTTKQLAPDPQEAQQSADQGTPEVAPATVQDRPPNPAAAMAAWQAHPMTQPNAAAVFAHLLKQNDPYTLAEGAKRMGPNGTVMADNPKPVPGFSLTPGGTRFDGKGNVVAAMPNKDELERAIEAAGIDPKSPEAQALFASRATKIATHAPPTKVSVSQTVSTEKKYGEKFATEIAQADSSMRDSAIKAPALAERANSIKQLLADGNVITGTAADFRLGMTKALALAGFKNADGTAVNTETLATGLAQNTLDAIKASGLGSGNGFSNADRDFLEKAVGGKINLERGTIDRLANLAHKAAEQTALRWSTRVKEIPASALEGTGIKSDPVTVPALFGAAAPGAGAQAPTAIGPGGQKLILRNNQWVPFDGR